MARYAPLDFLRWIAVALLAVIALQALPAQAVPPALDRGPAFSVSSVEVALPPRREVRADVRVAPVPLPPRPAIEWATPGERLVRAEPWPAHRQQAPPANPPRRSIASPREPPLA